ncbi:MAG: thioredoxin family protein [Desulfomonilaceae bacterium]
MSQEQDDVVRIRVADFDVGVIGLKRTIEEISESSTDRTDEEIQAVLLDRLSRKNYIPGSARTDYGKAFIREFRKFLGQPYEEDAGGPVSVVVVGPGCAECKRLEQSVMVALNELGIPASLDHITDMKEASKYGFIATPGLIINGEVVSCGTVPQINKIKEWLNQATNQTNGG